MQLVVDAINPIVPANQDFWLGSGQKYAVVLKIIERPTYYDNAETIRCEQFKIDLWTKSANPSADVEAVRAALKSAGLTVWGGAGDADVISNVLWYCSTLYAEHQQEVD